MFKIIIKQKYSYTKGKRFKYIPPGNYTYEITYQKGNRIYYKNISSNYRSFMTKDQIDRFTKTGTITWIN